MNREKLSRPLTHYPLFPQQYHDTFSRHQLIKFLTFTRTRCILLNNHVLLFRISFISQKVQKDYTGNDALFLQRRGHGQTDRQTQSNRVGDMPQGFT